jgi:hypothetical protein
VKFFRTILTLALVNSVMGCLGAPEDDPYATPAAEPAGAVDVTSAWLMEEEEVGVAEPSAIPAIGQPDSSGDVVTTAVRYCGAEFDCNSACDCINGTCQPDGFGPPPEGDYCAQPPQRACSSSSQCRSACDCVNGTCQPDGFGPPPEGDYCAQPPPDAYEYNDSYNSATAYLGSPQLGHNFHEPGDVDWILVYFGSAMTATFETYSLTNGANTYLAVYSYNYVTGQLGALVGSNDDVCGFWWAPTCWASRVVVGVPANSVYAIQVSDINGSPQSVYDQNAPGYAFRIY